MHLLLVSDAKKDDASAKSVESELSEDEFEEFFGPMSAKTASSSVSLHMDVMHITLV